MKLAFIMDPPSTIKPYKDSSLALMQAALDLGHSVYYFMQPDLFIAETRSWGNGMQVSDISDQGFTLGEKSVIPLGDFDVIFMRKDPPVDKVFLQTTFILAQAERDGARVVNSPAALQNYNEKIYATHFPDLTPKTLVSADQDTIKSFVKSVDRAVLKPVDMMGGYGVFVTDAKDFNLDVIIEMLTIGGSVHIIVQEFMPQISEGDRRVILINGKIAEYALVRYPKEGSLRGNMAAGGTTGVEEANDRDREIASLVGPRLVHDGVYFVGLDIIGGKLIEINHTSPTGLREIEKGSGEQLARKVIEGLKV
jgi:glutathione synthase